MVVKISLLGTIRVTCDDRPIDFGTIRAQHLLAFLALSPGIDHPREYLATLLWPDHDGPMASTNLRQTLSRLKRSFPASARDALFDTGGRTIRFNPQGATIDVTEFESALAACATHLHLNGASCAQCFARREQAVSHYQGDLLEEMTFDFSIAFEEWVAARRQYLKELLLEALGLMGEQYRLAGEYQAMAGVARRQITIDSWRESGHRQMMLAHALGGDRAAAVAHYHALRNEILGVFGIEPDEETRSLFTTITQGELGAESGANRIQRQVKNLLPTRVGPFIGREPDIPILAGMLRDPASRLVTVTGVVGVGKTRFAIEMASILENDFPDGVVWVPLAPLGHPDHVWYAVADALDVRVASTATLLPRLASALEDRSSLIVLDNFEHVLAAAPVLGDLLQACPGIRWLVTSREPLGLPEERQYRLFPLALPDDDDLDPDEAHTSSAVRLFASQAARHDPAFVLERENIAAVNEICRRLDGLPLALELAASRMATLPPSELLARLAQRLPLLRGPHATAPGRQQTMHAAIAWSYDLLEPGERRVFVYLATFTGGFTLQQLERLLARCDGNLTDQAVDIVQSLLFRSLLQREDRAGLPTRYSMLETLHEFASGILQASGKEEQCRLAHADILIDQFNERLVIPFAPDDREWYAMAASEYANLQDIHAYLRKIGDTTRYGRLACALAWYWFLRGNAQEGRNILEFAILHRDILPADQVTGMAAVLGVLRLINGDSAGCLALLEQELANALTSGNHIGTAQVHIVLGVHATLRQAYREAMNHQNQALSALATLPDSPIVAAISGAARANMGVAAREQGELDSAEHHHLTALDFQRRSGAQRGEMLTLIDLGDVARERGEWDEALTWYRQGLILAQRENELRVIVHAVQSIAHLDAEAGQPARAAALMAATSRWKDRHGSMERIARPHANPHAQRDRLRCVLGERAFNTAWHSGRRMTFEALQYQAQSLTLT